MTTNIQSPSRPEKQNKKADSARANSRQFSYEALDPTGAQVKGGVSARSRHEAGSILSGRGLFVSQLSTERRLKNIPAKPRATRAQLANQFWQLATMVEAGIGLSECLDCLARQGSDPRLRALLQDTSEQVQEGKPLSEAMGRHPRSYPASLVAMVRASEHSGSLGKVLRQCSVYLDKDLRLVARMRTALMYPVLLLLVTSGVLMFLLTFVLPKFSVIFASRGAELPVLTTMMLEVSQSIVGYWPLWIAGGVALAACVRMWARSTPGRRSLDHFIVTAPGVRAVSNALYQSRTFRALAMLVDARVPLVDAIGIVRDIVPNASYRELWDELEEQIKVGERFATPLFESEFVDESIAQMIDKGDKSGKMGMAFARVADYLEEKYERTIAGAMQFMEPVLLLVIGGLVGVVVISMLLPLFQAAGVVAG